MKGFYNKTFYEIGKWIMAVAFAAAIFIAVNGDAWLVKMPDCTFEAITGLYCPGCGGTRSVIALFKGNLIKSFMFHPAVPYAAICLVVFMVRMFLIKHFNIGKEKDGRVLIFIYIGIAIVLLQWIIKLILLIKYNIALL